MVIFSCLYNQFHFCIVQHKPRASVNVSGVDAGMRGFRAGPAAYGNSPFPKPLTIIIKMQNWYSIYDLGIYEDGKKNRSKRRLHAAQELQECRRPPGFDGVPDALLGAAYIAFFQTSLFSRWLRRFQILCDRSLKLFGQFSYDEEFDFRFQIQTSSFSGYCDF